MRYPRYCHGFAYLFFSLVTSNNLYANSLTDNLRLSPDISTRAVHSENRDQTGWLHAFGIDTHNVLSSDNGDWATLIMQLYLTRIDGLTPHPGFFEDEDDWELVTRIFNINFTRLGPKLPNFKVGHIELPFGIEYTIGTNGDLRDYNHGKNLGPKADWGFGINNTHRNFVYEITYTTGGGQSFKQDIEGHILTGRFGSSPDEDWVYGLSFYDAQLGGTNRNRYTIDSLYYINVWGIFSEIAIGEKGSQNQLDGLVELNWRSQDSTVLAYGQFQYFSNETQNTRLNNSLWVLGTQYTPNSHIDLSMQVKRDLETPNQANKETKLSLQARYRF